MQKIPINRENDGELLGFAVQSGSGWQAETVFGYVFARSSSQSEIEDAVRMQGSRVIQGLWQYLDPDDKEWYPCVLSKVAPLEVTVVRTNDMGLYDQDTIKFVTLRQPNDTMLVKA